MTLIAAALLLVAVWHDIATRTIPDWVSIALVVIGIAVRLGEGPMAAGVSALTAAALFGLLVIVHAKGGIGGGDVKLAAAIAVGLPPLTTVDFVLLTALAGGALAIAYLLLGRLLAAHPVPTLAHGVLPRRIVAVEWRRLCRGGPLPYAIAIAIGGLIVLSKSIGG